MTLLLGATNHGGKLPAAKKRWNLRKCRSPVTFQLHRIQEDPARRSQLHCPQRKILNV